MLIASNFMMSRLSANSLENSLTRKRVDELRRVQPATSFDEQDPAYRSGMPMSMESGVSMEIVTSEI